MAADRLLLRISATLPAEYFRKYAARVRGLPANYRYAADGYRD